jgi:hypothetical protein
MQKVPFEKQILPPDYLSSAITNAKAGKLVSGDDLLHAVEQGIGLRLPEAVRGLVRQSTIPARKARGRPRSSGAALDFALLTVDQRHPPLLRKYQDEARTRRAAAEAGGAKLPKTDHSPSERAYRRILTTMQKDFGNIDWKALRNLHIRWKKGCFHRAENPGDGPEDVEEAIEQYLASLKPRSY